MGTFLANSGTFRFGGILTCGRFGVHTQIEGRTGSTPLCGVDLIISEFNKKPRISELASLGNLDSG